MPTRISLIIRFLFFCVFFSIGAGTVAFSILLDPELSIYFRNRRVLAQLEAENKRIEELTEKYQMQIDMIRREPNLLGRLELVTFGKAYRPKEADASNVPIFDKNLQETARAVLAEIDSKPEDPPMPKWFERCLQPNIRTALFLAGSGLVIITFIFFGSPSIPADSSKEQPD
ncbi:MAG TPA: hypothetical protein PLV55_01015 [Anaerohalosphaeraceae bacterium]|nr:hypothetical protein [Anaerohalosphaeraceae bacterium]